jgi:hypothetical protein
MTEFCLFVDKKVEIKRGPWPARYPYCGEVDQKKCLVTRGECLQPYAAMLSDEWFKSHLYDEVERRKNI